MEQIRLLTNLETNKHKLLQIFLIGQPELRRMLEREGLRQINQRITARFHLRPLTSRRLGTTFAIGWRWPGWTVHCSPPRPSAVSTGSRAGCRAWSISSAIVPCSVPALPEPIR